MNRTIAMLGLLLVTGGSAYGAPAAGEVAPQGGQHHGPPPEAYTACEGKTEGSTAQITGRDGETITGICRIADGKLVLRPDRGKGNPVEGRQGPPPEAYAACTGKKTGSISQFIDPRGETLKGTCEEEDGKMVLRPDANKTNRQGPAQKRDGREQKT
jgi:hypothetical protein